MKIKLREVMDKIESGNFSPETYEQLHKSLRRSGSDFLRSQHCRGLAQQVLKSNSTEAKDYALLLLNDAEKMYADCSGTELSSIWQSKGNLFFDLGEYEKAYDNFLKWEKAYTTKQSGLGGVHHDLLRSVLLQDNFTMSNELKRVYTLSKQESNFIVTRNMKLYWLVSEMIMALHENDMDLLKSRQLEALQIIDTRNRPSDLEKTYKKNRIKDDVSLPDKVIDYIKRHEGNNNNAKHSER